MAQKPPKFCWGCGNQLKADQKFCTRCGKSITSQIKTSIDLPHEATTPKIQYERVTPKPKEKPLQLNNSQDLQPVLVKVTEVEQKLDSLESFFGKKFEKLGYKINALDVENRIIDLNSKFDRLKPENESPILEKQLKKLEKLDHLENLVTIEDIKNLQEKVERFDFQNIEAKINLLEEDLTFKLKKIEEGIENFNSDEKIVNLAKNTVDRLNSLDKNVEDFNLETRTRLSKMDNKIEDLNSALATLVPTLLKLNEKVSKLLVQSSTVKSGSLKSKESTKPPKSKSKLDLPPFPA